MNTETKKLIDEAIEAIDPSLETRIKREINHILDSGANDIRLFELFERYARIVAELKVSEQRDIMARHLNMRNVPKPELYHEK